MPTRVVRIGTGNSGTTLSGSFRDFVSFVQEAFSASGFVNTGASGSINALTVDPPTAINQVRGYDVFRFNDALQSTSPFFIRVNYRSLGQVGSPGVGLIIGEFHDGSGTVASAYGAIDLAVGNVSNTAFSTAQSGSCLYTGESGSRIAVALQTNVSGAGAFVAMSWFNISRTRDWNGNYDGRGVEVIFGGGTGSTNNRAGTALIRTDEYGHSYNASTANFHSILLSTLSGSETGTSPIFIGKGVINPPSPDALHAIAINFPQSPPSFNITGTLTTGQMYGINHTYIVLPVAFGGGTNNLQTSQNNTRLLLRYA